MQPPRSASTSTRQGSSPLPRSTHPNTQTKVLDSVHGRILCIADIRGRHSALNDLAREANAKAIIHTGDFGFFDANSLDRINDRTLRHLTQYSPLIPNAQRSHLLAPENSFATIRSTVNINLLSEFPLLLSGQIKLQIPVFTVWGACEDVNVLEKIRNGTFNVENLQVIDEATTRCLDVGGVKLRLLGLGGALVPHKMFDNGDGNATIAGGQGTMWTTALQIGELVDTAQRVFNQSETRLLITHASPGREGILAQLALVLKADLTISAGLHFRYASSYNEFSVQGEFEGFRKKLMDGKEGFEKVWESVKSQVDAVIDDNQRVLLDKALSVVDRVPPAQPHGGPGAGPLAEEPAWKNCWNWNLCDAAYGSLVLDVKDGRVSAELKSQGFNYAYRRTATPSTVAATPNSANATLPTNLNATTGSPSPKGSTSVPQPDKALASQPANSTPTSPPPPSVPETSKEVTSSNNGNGNVKSNGVGASSSNDKYDKSKRKDKKERRERERPDGDSKAKKDKDLKEEDAVTTGKDTPQLEQSTPEDADQLKSPVDSASPGARTPTSKRPPRNPWTIFMRMSVPANEAEVREFFSDAKEGITRINYPNSPPGRAQKIVYVEFGDEKAMRDGLEKHAEKLNDSVPEVQQATDRESRGESPHYSRSLGRGRGRSTFARGFAAAGLTNKGHNKNEEATPKNNEGA